MTHKAIKKIANIATVCLFALILVVPLAAKLVGMTDMANVENRRMASLPNLAEISVTKYPKEFEAFFNDNFSFRNRFIYFYRKYQLELLGSRNTGAVLLGADDWLYYRKDGDSISDYLGLKPLDEHELQKCHLALNDIQKKLNDAKIEFLFVIAPNKCTIYPEFLPEDIRVNARKTHRQQLLEYIAQNGTDAKIIDLSQTLLQAKQANPQRLYFKLDTHWNAYGRYIAYKTICDRLDDIFDDLHPMTIGDTIKVKSRQWNDFDMLKLLGNYASVEVPDEDFLFIDSKSVIHQTTDAELREILDKNIPEGSPAGKLTVFENKDGHGKCVIICDSFFAPWKHTTENGDEILQMEWSQHFARTVRLHPGGLNQEILQYIIEKEKPDIVILEYIERAVHRLRKTAK